MPNQDNANQKSQADLDRQIIDLGHAIALNPKNASAYRDRALLNVRKRDFTHALNDLDQAIFLNSKDAIAYYYRGYIRAVRKENTKAIEDFGKAIELDPARGEFYRAQREKLLKEGASQNQPQTNIDPNSSQVGSNESTQKGLAGFCKRLAQYYAEFLSTDFKKQRLPRRRLQTADAQGHLVGIPLRKYAGFQQEMWERLGRSIRDYAEFIPLEHGLFDLVIIDEASQVSIAQALPAIVRAKKVLVLGDRSQFGNVKTSNASKEVNKSLAILQVSRISAFGEERIRSCHR